MLTEQSSIIPQSQYIQHKPNRSYLPGPVHQRREVFSALQRSGPAKGRDADGETPV